MLSASMTLTRLRSFLLVLFALTGALVLIWLLTSSIQHRLTRERLVALAQADIAASADRFSEVMRSYVAITLFASRDERIQRTNLRDPAATGLIGGVFTDLAVETPDIAQVRLLSLEGDELIRLDRKDGVNLLRAPEELQNKGARDYIVAARSLPPRGVFISAIELNMEHGRIEEPWRPVVRIATPLDNAAGIFIINFDAGYLLSIFAAPTQGGTQLALLDRNGYWLTGGGKEQLWGAQLAPETTMARLLPELWSAVATRTNGITTIDGTVYVYRTFDYVETVGARLAEPHALTGAMLWHAVGAVTPEAVDAATPGLPPVAIAAAMLVAILTSWLWSGSIAGRRRAMAAQAESQSQLVRTERSVALGNMVAGVAHELNTPIGNAVTVASTIAEQIDAFEAQLAAGALKRSTLQAFVSDLRQGTTVMLRGLAEAARLVGDFKEIAVDQVSEKRRDFELDAYIEELSRTLAHRVRRSPVTLELDAASQAAMNSFPGALGQVVMNLVNNALDHGFAGRSSGTITISTRALDEDAVEILIADDGSGIPQHLQTRIFDPFFTTRLGQGGSGLGLSIVSNIVTQVLGGTVTVTSTPGEATVFTVTLPRRAPDNDTTRGGAT